MQQAEDQQPSQVCNCFARRHGLEAIFLLGLEALFLLFLLSLKEYQAVHVRPRESCYLNHMWWIREAWLPNLVRLYSRLRPFRFVL